ncbi:hypothetical protein BE21_11970 [Sorangium cellulosum]|uniref:Uncharacterized protein n=1 Tax=Sorangium cellulosum TaxID=56 RepID=A0A150U0G3_SORCE|nr:hypothetical protein BE21_11970 [Sorangium cellulosum]
MHDMSEQLVGALSAVLWVAFGSSASGCVSHPEVSGKVIITRDGEELVLDTGGNGTRVVDASGEVAGGCIVRNQTELSVTVQKEGVAFSFFDLVDQAGLPHVSAEIDGKLYQGACEIIVEERQGDPYEADVAAGPCDLVRLFDGAEARLEMAIFHVSDCSGAE